MTTLITAAKETSGLMDLVKKRPGSADLHSPINPPLLRVDM